MIVVDTSAIITIMLRGPGHERLADIIAGADACIISPISLLEATMVMSRYSSNPKTSVDNYLRETSMHLCAVDMRHAELAQEAFLKFGKGRHPARLNFGDCFTYAAAKALDAPLLFVGKDFAQTDVRAA